MIMLETAGMFEGPSRATRREVFHWWGARWWDYNAMLFLVGIGSWLLVLIAGSAAVKPGDDFEEPLAMIAGPVIYLVLANICFMIGPMIDILFYVGRPRATLFKSGLWFSIVLTAWPGLWAVVAWIMTLYTGHKLP